MAVQRGINPADDKEVIVIVGKVERIKIVEAEATARNIEFGVTHVASIVVDNQWINYISLGIKGDREPNLTINTGSKDSPQWVQIDEGDDVRVVVQETIKGDKTYYNAKRTGIKLVAKGTGGSSKSSGGQGSQSTSGSKFKTDKSGIAIGHSVNGAMNFLITWGVDASNENLVEYSKKVHAVTEKLKVSHKAANPDMNEYEVDASSGHAVLNACKLVGTDQDFEEGVYAIAQDLLQNVVKPVSEFIRTPKQEAPPAKATRAPAKKPPATKAKAAEKPKPKPEPERRGFDDMDDDIPF